MAMRLHGGGTAEVGARPVDEAVQEKADDTMDAVPQLRRRLRRSDLTAVPEARRALRALLRHGEWSGRSETAELLASELVTNALLHTDHDAVLTAVVGPRALRVEVRDFVSHWPRQHPVDAADAADSTHGRGLLLVRSLADAWGVRAHAVGKSVWFELAAQAT